MACLSHGWLHPCIVYRGEVYTVIVRGGGCHSPGVTWHGIWILLRPTQLLIFNISVYFLDTYIHNGLSCTYYTVPYKDFTENNVYTNHISIS